MALVQPPIARAIVAPAAQRIDELGERLPRSLSARAGNARADLNLVSGRLRRDLIDARIARLTERLAAAWTMAGLVHPDRPLSRGFVRVTDRDGRRLCCRSSMRRRAAKVCVTSLRQTSYHCRRSGKPLT